MKSRILTYTTAMILFAALAIPAQVAAQDDSDSDSKPKHHHYKLIVMGTLGGPQSYGDPGHGPVNINNRRTAVGVADTSGRCKFPAFPTRADSCDADRTSGRDRALNPVVWSPLHTVVSRPQSAAAEVARNGFDVTC